jgi:AcrR family transcriptional regulator
MGGGNGWRYPSPSNPVPVPTQRRARETVRAAIDATIDLLARLPEDQVTLEAVRTRAGVSQGSLTHHFGGRDALIATANVERYSRTCDADAQFFARLEGALMVPEQFATILLTHIDDMLSPARHEVRWIRLSAIAAAFGDEDLAATLSGSYTRLTDQLTEYVHQARESGILQPDADARTVALLLSMQAQGLVLDDLVEHDVPLSAWNHFMVRFVACFVTSAAATELARREEERYGDLWRADVFGSPGRVPLDSAARLDALRSDVAGSDVAAMEHPHAARALLEHAERGAVPVPEQRASVATLELRSQVLRAASVMVRERGARGVDVSTLRERFAMSPQSFHRLFGTRDALVREARVRLELSRSAHSIARFATMVGRSRSPADMRVGLEADGVWMAEDASRTSMWQRIETLAATRTDPELRAALARVQQTTRDLLIEQVCIAQGRGLMDPELPARSVARFLDGTVFWHVFHGLDGNRPAREDWTAMLARLARLLSPDR